MKFCTYMNNLLSLEMLSKQGLKGEINYVHFYKDIVNDPDVNYIIFFNGINYIYFSLRVEEVIEDRIIPLVLDISSLYDYGLIEIQRILPIFTVKLMFGGD